MVHLTRAWVLGLALFCAAAVMATVLPHVAKAQAVAPRGGGSSTPSATDHVGQALVALSYSSSAASGAVALGLQNQGARIEFGAAGLFDYLSSNSSGEIEVGGGQGSLKAGKITASNQPFDASGNGYLTNGFGLYPLKLDDADGYRFVPKSTLPTCGSGQFGEGTLFPVAGTGGTTTKACFCTSDGTTFKWRNLLNPSDTSGTTTACP